MKELLIGCGAKREKLLYVGEDNKFHDLVTLDNNPDHNPDCLWDLTKHPLPFDDNTFDEIHAYEVLEHLTYQGDYKFFFAEFSEYHRILKPNGIFFATVPALGSRWVWGDPSHKRVIQLETLTYLFQDEYKKQVGKTAISDFRYIYKADFQLVYSQEGKDTFAFAIKAIK